MKDKPLSEKREVMGEDDMMKIYYFYREEDVKEAVEKLKEEFVEGRIETIYDIDQIFGEFK